jgi:hypothetical protein
MHEQLEAAVDADPKVCWPVEHGNRLTRPCERLWEVIDCKGLIFEMSESLEYTSKRTKTVPQKICAFGVLRGRGLDAGSLDLE